MCHDSHDGPCGRSRHAREDRPYRRGWDDGPDWDRGPDRGPPRDEYEYECDCGCHDRDDDLGFERHFTSRAETLEALEWYLRELQNEAQGVKEAIADLKKEMAAAGTDEPAPEVPPAPARPARSRKK